MERQERESGGIFVSFTAPVRFSLVELLAECGRGFAVSGWGSLASSVKSNFVVCASHQACRFLLDVTGCRPGKVEQAREAGPMRAGAQGRHPWIVDRKRCLRVSVFDEFFVALRGRA
jgi:hypothetical protein